MSACRSITFEDLLVFWKLIDTKNSGFITFDQFDDALRKHASLETALGIHSLVLAHESGQIQSETTVSTGWLRSADQGDQVSTRRERELFFKSLDFLGDGEVTFSDFVYGILSNVAPPRTIMQLVFDHQFTRFVRSCGHACKTTLQIHNYLKARTKHTVEATS